MMLRADLKRRSAKLRDCRAKGVRHQWVNDRLYEVMPVLEIDDAFSCG